MKFFIAFAIVCALLIGWIYITEASWCDNDELTVHDKAVIGCTGRRMQLNEAWMDATCIPRHTLVKLIPQPGYVFHPNYAPVKRCNGYCTTNKSCMPVRKNMKKIVVKMEGYNSSECYHVFVEEHLKCKCECSVKESHCNGHQMYSENNCACECMNREECDISRHMIWNEKLCKCICNKPEEICSSGLEWVPSRCGCAKVMDMPTHG